MANELIVTNAAALAALVDKTTGDTLTAAEYTTLKDSLQEANAATRTANTVFAGPTTGAAAAPTFRALVAADIPSLSAVYQPLDATLTALAALGAGPGFLQVTGADTFSIAELSGAQVNTALEYTAANAAALNATNLTSGTVPDARFPATLPALNGSALTALNASNLGSGTIPDSRFPAVLPAISGANLTNLPGGVSGLTAGVIPVATSATAIANSKWTMTGTNLGTATLYDDTAVTGRSAIAIREGAGQSTDYTFAVVDNSNSTFYARLTGGAGAQFQAVAGFGDTVGGLRLTGNLLHLRSGGVINWNANAGDILGSPDTGLARAAAGILKITDGSTGFGNLSLGTRVEFGGDIGFTRWNSGLIAPITSGGSFAGLFVEQILGTDGAQQRFNLKANGTNPFLRFGSGGSVLWTSIIAEGSATDDTGIVRAPIGGIVRATNGSTGDGGFQGVSLQGASSKALAAATPTGFVDIPVASDARIGGIIEYCVETDDGTDFQIESGVIQFAAVNKAGTVSTASPTATGTPLQVRSSGTMTVAFTATAGADKITINCDAASSLTETTLRIRFRVHVNSSTTAIAVAPL